MYFLGVDNCIYSSSNVRLLCDVTDFEVTIDKRIYALTDINSPAGNDGIFIQEPTSSVIYTKYNIYKDLTLIKDEPIFID